MSEKKDVLTKYRFDIYKIVEFFNVSSKNKETLKEITDTFVLPEDSQSKDLELESRVMRQVNGNGDTNIDNIKYDLVKLFINAILTSQTETFGIDIAIQSMLSAGLMEEIKDEK